MKTKAKKKVRQPKWTTSREPSDVLLRAASKYVAKRKGKLFIVGPIGVMDAHDPRRLGNMEKFYLTIGCFGVRPNTLTIAKGPQKESECCKAKIFFGRGDGVSIGHCEKCQKSIVRVNPRTGNVEMLNGNSPWTEQDAPEAKR